RSGISSPKIAGTKDDTPEKRQISGSRPTAPSAYLSLAHPAQREEYPCPSGHHEQRKRGTLYLCALASWRELFCEVEHHGLFGQAAHQEKGPPRRLYRHRRHALYLHAAPDCRG